jgi:hypothetical protein
MIFPFFTRDGTAIVFEHVWQDKERASSQRADLATNELSTRLAADD